MAAPTGTPPVVVDDGRVRTITFNRPEVRNALTLDDLDVVVEAVRTAGDAVDGLVFTGAGDRAFSSGMHVDTFTTAAPDDGRAVIDRVGACVRAVRLSPLPTLAVVNGYCLGAAFELVLACDVRIAHPQVQFGLPEVRLGIPSVIEAALLVAHIGLSKAKEMMLTGGLYSAADLPPGLVNREVPAAQLGEATNDMLRLLTAPTREVLAAQKALFDTWLEVGLDEGIEVSKAVFGQVFALDATQRAVDDYRSTRRSPVTAEGASPPPA